MNIKKDDYVGLLNEVSIASDHEFTANQINSLVWAIQEIGWSESYRMIVHFIRRPSLPKNIYGVLLEQIDQIRYEQKKALEKKDDWRPASEEMAAPEEFVMTMKVIGILSRFKGSCDLLIKNGETMGKAIDQGNLLGCLYRIYGAFSEKAKDKNNLKPNFSGLI